MLLLFLNGCPLLLLCETKRCIKHFFLFLVITVEEGSGWEALWIPNITPHMRVVKEALARRRKKKSGASKTNSPQSKAAYIRFPVLLLLLPRRVLWLCLHELTLTLLRSRLWGRYQWAKPDALSLGNLATHSCTAPDAFHINAWTAGQHLWSTVFFLVTKLRIFFFKKKGVCASVDQSQSERLCGPIAHLKRLVLLWLQEFLMKRIELLLVCPLNHNVAAGT